MEACIELSGEVFLSKLMGLSPWNAQAEAKSPAPSLLTDWVGVGMKNDGSPSAKEYCSMLWGESCGGAQPPGPSAVSSMTEYREGVHGIPSRSVSFSISRGKQVETAEEGGLDDRMLASRQEPNEDSKSVAMEGALEADRSDEPGVNGLYDDASKSMEDGSGRGVFPFGSLHKRVVEAGWGRRKAHRRARGYLAVKTELLTSLRLEIHVGERHVCWAVPPLRFLFSQGWRGERPKEGSSMVGSRESLCRRVCYGGGMKLMMARTNYLKMDVMEEPLVVIQEPRLDDKGKGRYRIP